MASSGDQMARLEGLETNVGVLTKDVGALTQHVGVLTKDVGALTQHVGVLTKDVGDLKAAAWRTAEILADHSERLSGLQRTLDDRLGAVTDRLDRLIAVTIQERTASTERLGDIERRLAKL